MNTNSQKSEKVTVFAAVDAEWQSSTNEPISVQLSFDKGTKWLFLNKSLISRYPLSLEAIEQTCVNLGITLVWEDLSSGDFDCLKYALTNGSHADTINLLMFYSPTDLMQLHGKQNFDWLVIPKVAKGTTSDWTPVGELTQKRNIQGSYTLGKTRVTIKDLKGWTTGSLKTLASSVAFELTDKGLMDKYKTNMIQGLIDDPENFIKYAMGDTDCLIPIYKKFTKNIQDIQENALGLPKDKCYNLSNISMTTGSIVANTFETILNNLVSLKIPEVLYRKLGILDPNVKTSTLKNNRKHRSDFLSSHKTLEAVKDTLALFKYAPDKSEACAKPFFNSAYQSFGYSLGSPQSFGRDTQTSAVHLAPVQGGRALNEIPTEFRLDYVLDVDLSSAYATAMNSLPYPIGRPRVEGFTSNQQKPTVRQLLKKLEGKATPGCWVMVVSGKLEFEQDLIMSKLVTPKQINNAIIGDMEDDPDNEDDLTKIPGPIVHLRQEIVNGVITQDVLEVIKKVASNSELKGFLDLDVVAVAYHLESDKFTNFEDWAAVILQDNGEYQATEGQIVDTRSYKWYSMPLSNVYGNLTDLRKAVKKQAKDLKPKADSGDMVAKAEYDKLHAEQEAMKLFINTGYGTLASVYFATANSIVGNNITAKVRVNSWMMAKALRCPQVITDGGLFTPTKVRQIKANSKLPSFNTLATAETLDSHRSVQLTTLAGLNWRQYFEQAEANPVDTVEIFKASGAEELTKEHINNFWLPWGLELTFGIELKQGHEGLAASYMGKADYCIKKPDGSYLFKIRGTKEYSEDYLKLHPKYEILKRLCNNQMDMSELNLKYNHTYLLKLGRYQEAHLKTAYTSLRGINPGGLVIEERNWKFNNTFIQFKTETDYKRVDRRNDEADGWFEKYLAGGWPFVLKKCLGNSLK